MIRFIKFRANMYSSIRYSYKYSDFLSRVVKLKPVLGSFRLDYEYEIEYEFQTSDISRALLLHVGCR